mmetsp:Transcript_8227/g.21817  ORF Transcript_8227/g.21817 Transcript_8227/m.21817 type:complete len:243 (+) Transcript_8227:963-1691(+)
MPSTFSTSRKLTPTATTRNVMASARSDTPSASSACALRPVKAPRGIGSSWKRRTVSCACACSSLDRSSAPARAAAPCASPRSAPSRLRLRRRRRRRKRRRDGADLGDAQGAAARAGALLRSRLLHAQAHETVRRFQLEPMPRGAFTGLKAHALDALGVSDRADAMTLRVVAVGVNFRDVLNVLGMYPGDRVRPAPTAPAWLCPCHRWRLAHSMQASRCWVWRPAAWARTRARLCTLRHASRT